MPSTLLVAALLSCRGSVKLLQPERPLFLQHIKAAGTQRVEANAKGLVWLPIAEVLTEGWRLLVDTFFQLLEPVTL